MALHWDISNVKDYNLLHNTAPEGCDLPHPKGSIEDFVGDVEWDITNTLIWATISVDMGKITEKNYEEFYRRLRMVGIVYGSPYQITLSDVKRRIGLSTNVITTTATQFNNKMKKRMVDDADRHVKTEARMLAEYESLSEIRGSEMTDDDANRYDSLVREHIRKHVTPVIEAEDKRRNIEKIKGAESMGY